MAITDAQIHIYDLGKDAKPEPAKRAIGEHRQNFPVEEAMREMDAIGVDRAVIVPPPGRMADVIGYAEAAADRYPGRIGLMPGFDPRAADARAQLEAVPNRKHWLGVRVYPKRNTELVQDPAFDWVWATCESLGIPVTCLVSGSPGVLKPIAERHPGLTISIDHMGRVPDVQGPAAFGALDQLLSLAPHQNVVVKVTSVPDSSAEPYPFRDLYGGLKQIYDAFGARRMLWGSDLSGLSSTYRECLDQFREGLDFLSAEDKEWILGKSAAAAYKWPE